MRRCRKDRSSVVTGWPQSAGSLMVERGHSLKKMTKSPCSLKRPRGRIGLVIPAVSAHPPILTLLISVLSGIEQAQVHQLALGTWWFQLLASLLRIHLVDKWSSTRPRFISFSLWLPSHRMHTCASPGYSEKQRHELYLDHDILVHRC